jgi:TolB-like protein/DNA-binding winged helix-turn-helix (wHTH) protein
MGEVPGFDVKLSQEAASIVRFAGYLLDLEACVLARESGEAIALSRGEFAVLRMFVARPGRVISRDSLLDAFADRRFEPFDRSVDVLIGKLRRKIEPDPKRPRLIVTVPGEGYRFDGLKQPLSSQKEPFVAAQASWPVVSVGSGGLKMLMSEDRRPPSLSIVVLPFANIGGDASQDYFVDGVTESLTTDLSRIDGTFVIGRSTASSYKNKAIDLKQIGRELNVRYVLEGSVQRGGNRMRVNVQLIEAESGAHLWAERFDKPIAALFDMQDEIVSRLANQLRAELIDAEARRAARAPNPDSMDFYFQGQALLSRGFAPDILAEVRKFFVWALEHDPSNIDALVGVGLVDMMVCTLYMTDDPAPLAAAAETNLAKALALAPNCAPAHAAMGGLLINTNRAQRGIEEFERALALDPNLARARAGIGLAHIFIGRAEETEAHVLEALRMSPRDSRISHWFLHAGGAKACLGEYAAGVVLLRKSIDTNRNNPWAHFYLAACLAHLGRIDDARQEVDAGLAVNPKFTICRFRAGVQSENATYLGQRERVIAGMCMAGAPEG